MLKTITDQKDQDFVFDGDDFSIVEVKPGAIAKIELETAQEIKSIELKTGHFLQSWG